MDDGIHKCRVQLTITILKNHQYTLVFSRFHLTENTAYQSFCKRLSSFNIMSSSFIHFAAYVKILLFLGQKNISLCLNNKFSLLVYLMMSMQVESTLAILNSAIINMGVQAILSCTDPTSFGNKPRRWLAGYYGRPYFLAVRNLCTSYDGCTGVHSQRLCLALEFSFLYILTNIHHFLPFGNNHSN